MLASDSATMLLGSATVSLLVALAGAGHTSSSTARAAIARKSCRLDSPFDSCVVVEAAIICPAGCSLGGVTDTAVASEAAGGESTSVVSKLDAAEVNNKELDAPGRSHCSRRPKYMHKKGQWVWYNKPAFANFLGRR